MIIKTKRESVFKMKELKLNYFDEDVFDVKDIKSIEKFFERTNADEYCMRDPDHTSGKVVFVKNLDECKNELKNYKGFVTICVSANDYAEDIVLLGDIKVKREYGNDTVDLTARTDSEATHRNIYENPQYNIHSNLEDDKLWNVPGFSKLMGYIADHDLYNLVIEFAVYDCPVGVNKEKVAIFELRSEY